MKVLCQLWVRGKGLRAAGYSLHKNESDRKNYIDACNSVYSILSFPVSTYSFPRPRFTEDMSATMDEFREAPLGEPYFVEFDQSSPDLSRLLADAGTGITCPGVPPKKCEE